MTSTASVPETILNVFRPIQQFTRGWMMTKETMARGIELGFTSGKYYWLVGRAGVLGACPVDVAIAGLAFHGDRDIRAAWDGIPEGMTPLEVAVDYSDRIHEWGDKVLGEFDEGRMNRLDELGRRIVDASPECLGALFAGWRQMPIPRSYGARVALTTHVLREQRMAAHLNAVIASGITPLDAVLASTNKPPRTGPEYAMAMGFEGPFRDPEEVRQARLDAEDLTNRILEPSYSVLDPEELFEFTELVVTTRNAIDM